MTDDNTTRLRNLVAQRLSGAQLLEAKQIERDDIESAYIVLWKNDREYGTHRAVVSLHDDRAMLVWGHYYLRDGNTARADYQTRTQSGA